MSNQNTPLPKPAIAITRSDHAKLSLLVDTSPESAAVDELALELDRARIVPDEEAGPIVRMGSTLNYSTDAAASRQVTLVFPGEADIAAGRISILTPIGAALIGLSAGQSIDWTARDGRTHRLTVEQVGDSAAMPAA